MDVVFCLLLAPFVLPVMVLLAILVQMDSPGPPIFVQERVGKGGHRFGMYKFRTMRRGLEDSDHKARMRAFVEGEFGSDGAPAATYKPIHESQITRLGRILRKTSLDELPQVINVLKGDMSLVGPRPNVLWEVESYQLWHFRRLEVLPGMTGLAQVRGRSCISFDSIVRYDIEYIENQSLRLDLKIILWTIPFLLSGEGAG
jgi:lipopolysaccharide/colanic/teichoic acid biosynthesis glycosyltransferase